MTNVKIEPHSKEYKPLEGTFEPATPGDLNCHSMGNFLRETGYYTGTVRDREDVANVLSELLAVFGSTSQKTTTSDLRKNWIEGICHARCQAEQNQSISAVAKQKITNMLNGFERVITGLDHYSESLGGTKDKVFPMLSGPDVNLQGASGITDSIEVRRHPLAYVATASSDSFNAIYPKGPHQPTSLGITIGFVSLPEELRGHLILINRGTEEDP
ncbi:MAG: hypothetical protein KDD53_12935, partial [Bdellovibrionales bacterium]|nr:hypothetical protein [Bdellovibrionales bacterium]